MTSPVLLPPVLREHAVRPGDPSYPVLRSTYGRPGAPAVILRPGSTQDVVAALAWAREQGTPLSIRSGGHGYTSTNDGGTVIDLGRINQVEVDAPGRGLVTLGPGARWAEVAASLSPHRLAVSAGDHGGVGVGGILTAGGIGWLVRSTGLAIDRLRGAELVTADGSVTWVDADTDTELFWALRGAGGQLGIVTRFQVQASPVGTVGHATVTLTLDGNGNAIAAWAHRMTTAPRELTSTLTVFPTADRAVGRLEAVVADHNPDTIRELLTHLLDGLPAHHVSAGLVDYADLLPATHIHPTTAQQAGAATTNGFLRDVDATAAAALAQAVLSPASALLQLRSVGGAMNDTPAPDTAFAHRDATVLAIATVFAPHDRAELDDAVAPFRSLLTGSYANFETVHDENTHARAFPGTTGHRLADVRRRVDPDRVFG